MEIVIDGQEDMPIPLYADRIHSIRFERRRAIYVDPPGEHGSEYTTGGLEEYYPGLLEACKKAYPEFDWSVYTL